MKRYFVTIFVSLLLWAIPNVLPAYDIDEWANASGMTKEGYISVRNGLITLDVQEADLDWVISEVARKSGIGITLGNGIKGKVTLKASSKSFEEILSILAGSNVFVYEYNPEMQTYRVIQAGAFSSVEDHTQRTGNSAPMSLKTTQSSPGSVNRAPFRSNTQSSARKADRETDSRGRPLFKTRELLVRFKPGIDNSTITELHQTLGSRVLRRIKGTDIQQVKIRREWSELDAVATYLDSGIVDVVERHALRYTYGLTSSDTYYNQLWGIEKTGISKAWIFTTGDSQNVIAVIDTGIDYHHPDLMANVWKNPREVPWNGIDDDANGYVDDVMGWDFAGATFENIEDGDMDPIDTDPEGHGTHIAGIIAAEGNNNIGVTGVSWRAAIMPLKVQADNSDTLENADIIEAIQYAIDNGAKIVNCSFGGETFSQLEYEAFEALRQNNILTVCAAGNNGEDTDNPLFVNYPSAYDLDNIISVTAGDNSDQLSSFSNYGAVSVDVMAPGTGIKSTIPAENPTQTSIVAGGGTATFTAEALAYAGITGVVGITGLIFDCGDGNELSDFPSGVEGNIALIKRDGVATFESKIRNAQTAGAIGTIIHNHVEGNFLGTIGLPGNWIPAASISKADGLALSGFVGTTITMTSTIADAPEHYAYRSGTSMAAPYVTGIASLLLSVDPGLSYSNVIAIIENTVDDISGLLGKVKTGGRVNARRALCSIAAALGDISADGAIGLDDAVLALRFLSHHTDLTLSPCIDNGVDVNGDGRIGIQEAVYIMESVAGKR